MSDLDDLRAHMVERLRWKRQGAEIVANIVVTDNLYARGALFGFEQAIEEIDDFIAQRQAHRDAEAREVMTARLGFDPGPQRGA